jgi:hypothetical protein
VKLHWNKILASLIVIGTVFGGVLVVEDRFNQSSALLTTHESIKLTNLILHNHAIEDYDLQIARLEAQSELSEADRALLLFYKSKRRNTDETLNKIFD